MVAVPSRVAAWGGIIALACVLLAGCAQPGWVPVEDRSTAPSRAERPPVPQGQARVHVVERGDTLYSIAWLYGLDYQDLARANGIEVPYIIYVDQRIRIASAPPIASGPPASVARSEPPPVPPAVPPAQIPQNQEPSTSWPAPASSIPEVRSPAPSVPSPSTPVPSTPVPATPVPALPSSGPAAVAVAGPWRRPTDAPVQRGYGNGNKGIDYQLAASDVVRSAAAGEVVYAGSGIGGFRHLVIVKHDPVYLSAYSFDRPLAVREGQRLDLGERLVEDQTGSTGRGALLHFEIRKNGAPVDPRVLVGGA